MSTLRIATPNRGRQVSTDGLGLNRRLRRSGDVLAAATIFIVVYGGLLMISPLERSAYSFGNFVSLVAPLAFAAIGVTLVLLTRGFDLSVAGIISLSNVICATYMGEANSPWTIVLLVLGIGLISGAINGALVVFLGLQSIAVSLATFIIGAGVALIILPAPGGQVPSELVVFLQGSALGLPVTLLFILGAIAFWMIFRRTRTGTTVIALGADRSATQLSGAPVKSSEFTAWMLAGLMYAVAGVFLSASTATGNPDAGTEYMLTAFAAAALGLVSFRGGRGSAIAAVFGAGTLIAIPKSLFAMGVASYWTGIFQGVVILTALMIPLIPRLLPAVTRKKVL